MGVMKRPWRKFPSVMTDLGEGLRAGMHGQETVLILAGDCEAVERVFGTGRIGRLGGWNVIR